MDLFGIIDTAPRTYILLTRAYTKVFGHNRYNLMGFIEPGFSDSIRDEIQKLDSSKSMLLLSFCIVV
jgi:hypothetical protein